MSSLRQQIVDELTRRISQINTAAGYSHTVKTVANWRKVPFNVSDLPALVIQDGAATVSDELSSNRELTHQLTIDIWLVVTGTATAAGCRSAMTDIVKAIGPLRSLGLAFDAWISITGHELAMEIDGDICGAGKVTAVVTYISDDQTI